MAQGVEAIIAAVLAASPRGQHAAALCAKADVLLAAGDLDTALACFDRALRIDVSFPTAWVGRAIILSARKRDNEALGCINRALDVDPRCAEALVRKGHILRGRGLHLEALGAYEAALGSSPSEEAHTGRVAMLRALGRSEAPRPASAPAPEKRPSEQPADKPRTPEKKSGRKSGRIDPRAEKPSDRLLKTKSIAREPGAEKQSFRDDPLLAKKSDPAILLGGPRSSPPSRPSQKMRRVSTSGAPVRLSQEEQDLATLDEVRALCLANRHVEALRKLEPVAKRSPGSRESWTLRAQILFALKQYDAALSSIERVTKAEPRDQDALRLMVKVLAATGKDVRALEAADRLVALAPRDAEVHRLRADCLVAAMRHVEAVVAYEKVIHYMPDEPSAWIALGRTLRQLRRVAEARMSLTKGLSLAEDKGATELAAQARDLLAKLPPSEE